MFVRPPRPAGSARSGPFAPTAVGRSAPLIGRACREPRASRASADVGAFEEVVHGGPLADYVGEAERGGGRAGGVAGRRRGCALPPARESAGGRRCPEQRRVLAGKQRLD